MRPFAALFSSPRRELAMIILALAGLAADFFLGAQTFLIAAAAIGSLPTLWEALLSVRALKVTIDTFNIFALGVSFATGEIRSAVFIVLMLAFAGILDWKTESRARNAVEELLKLKPQKAVRETPDGPEEISAEAIREGDILIVKEGSQVPVDGRIVFGSGFVNESLVTGESAPVPKMMGDEVLGSTTNESGVLKIKAVRVGEDSTLERMAALIREAAKNKSRSEKIADRFAAIFLPVVILAGIVTYIVTRNIVMTAALFLVACADDMAVAIPLAVTASLGYAAKRGVIVKGGEWLAVLGKVDTVVLDKTGTLTYGAFAVEDAHLEKGIEEGDFWKAVGAAEKFSEHPIGKAIFRRARADAGDIADPLEVKVHGGAGIWARTEAGEAAIGNDSLMQTLGIPVPARARELLDAKREKFGGTSVAVFLDRAFAGVISVADVPRGEAGASIARLREIGVRNIFMFTGDNDAVARKVGNALGIGDVRSSMKPQDKLAELERLIAAGRVVAMIGDGVNDAPALARANVGVAMGRGGTAIAAESADVVILTDDLTRLSEMILLGRKTASVVNWDVLIWVLSNAFGFFLVLSGFAGPAIAAFYNFATDFLPLLNSTRLFRRK